jgi:hypothetical protein
VRAIASHALAALTSAHLTTDGCHRRPNGDESLLTLMIYLNGGVRGGETRFDNAVVRPAVGLALVFDHYLTHEGAVVLEGRKYVLRSDVMYGPPDRPTRQDLAATLTGHPPRATPEAARAWTAGLVHG